MFNNKNVFSQEAGVGEDFSAADFGSDFKWGVTTAAFQIEGSCGADGKGPSIWDVFTSRKGKIKNGDTASVACDFYNCYQKDIALVRRLNIPNFRFSVAWSRVLPEGTGRINQKGIDFYNRLIDHCLENEIDPWLTLYHWDLPQALEKKGGWTNRDIVSWFDEYAGLCARNFGDRVKHWLVMNEPMVFAGAGYFLGIHAPGRTGLGNFLPAVHHVVLGMSSAGNVLRSILPSDAQIGSTFSCSHIEPRTNSRRDIEAAKRADLFLNRLFLEPVLGLGYPLAESRILRRIEKYIKPGDAERMAFNFDFIGLQNYTREIVEHSWLTPYIHAKILKAGSRKVPTTEMGWEVYPPAIYHIIKKYDSYAAIKRLIITENGAAFPDVEIDGKVKDFGRQAFIKDNISQVLRAKKEGCKVDGYFVWTLTDNFEWAEGYHPRFGLIYIDYQSQKRLIKSSGKWYADFLSARLK